MANWKKMAEAFGRALNRPDIRNEMNTFGKNSKQGVKDRSKLFDDMEASANEAGASEEFYEGWDHGERDATRADRKVTYGEADYEPLSDEPRQPREYPDQLDRKQKAFDEMTDERTDRALEENRQKEWDDAFSKAKDRVKRDYGDDYPKDMAEEGARAFEDQLWDVINELKSQGRSTEDILSALKSMGKK